MNVSGMSTAENVPEDDFKVIQAYIIDSWRIGKRNVNLWSYFIVAIFLVGGLGFWTSIVTVINDWQVSDVLFALCTYAPTIVAATCLDLIFERDDKKCLKSFGIVVGALVCVLVVVSLLCKNYWYVAYPFSVLSVIVAYWIWFLVNANNSKLREDSNYKTPVGDTDKRVPGNEEGYDL